MKSPRCGGRASSLIAASVDELQREQKEQVWRTLHSQRFSGKLHSESAECHMAGPGLQVVADDKPTGRAKGPPGAGASSIGFDGALKSSRETSSRLKRCSSRYDALQHQSRVLTGDAATVEPRIARRVDPNCFARQFAGSGVSALMASDLLLPESRIASAAPSTDVSFEWTRPMPSSREHGLSSSQSVRQKMLAGAGSFW